MKISVILEMLTANFETDTKRAEKLFKQSVNEIEQTAKRAGVAIGAALAAGATAMAALAKESIDTADELSKLSQSTGVSIETLSKMKFAAEQSGSSIVVLAKGLQKLAIDAEAGGSKLARVGVSATDSAGKMRSTNDILLDVAERFKGMKDGAEKAAFAQELFGKSGVAMIPFLNQGKEGIKQLTDQAKALGLELDSNTGKAAEQFNDNLSALSAAAMGLGNDIAKNLLPMLVELTNATVAWVEQIRTDGTLDAWIESLREAGEAAVTLAEFIVARLAVGALVSLATGLAGATSAISLAKVATNAWRLSLALLGGPIGLAISAAAAIAVALYNYESSLDQAREANVNLVKAVELLKTAQGKGIGPMLQAVVAAREEAQAKLELAQADLAAAKARAELTKQAQQYTQASGGEAGARAASAGLAVVYERDMSAIEDLSAVIESLQGNIANSNVEIDAAKARLKEWEDQIKNASGETVTLGKSTADLAKEQKEQAEAAKLAEEAQKKLSDEYKKGAEDAAQAAQQLSAMLDQQAAQLGGPSVAAAIEFKHAMMDIAELELRLLALGPPSIENQRMIAEARQNATEQYHRNLTDIELKEKEALERSKLQADEVGRIWENAGTQMSYVFGDMLTGQLDSFSDFTDALKSIWKRAIADMFAAQIRNAFTNFLSGSGSSSGGLLSMFTSAFGGSSGSSGAFAGATAGAGGSSGVGAAAGGAGSLFSSGGGMLQNGFSMGGAVGAAGGIMTGLQGIRTGNPLQGAVGGAMAGAQIGGPWGAVIGAVVGGLAALINGKKEPDFRLGGSSASIRNREGRFSTVFGEVQAGSRQLSWESLVQPMQQFDSAIHDLVMTMGGGQEQIDAIAGALRGWEVDLKGSAATAENVLGSRFNTILDTFSQEVQDFVGTTGTVQERVGKLTDALAIQSAVDAGLIGDSFAEVSSILTDYRHGTEAIGDTYARVVGSVSLLDTALSASGVTLDMTRNEMIRFATDITEAAGSLERANGLWSSYFQQFYTDQERALIALNDARSNAAREFTDIGLNASDFSGSTGAADFRAMFEQALPTLSAEAVVQWLEAANALGIWIDLSAQYASTVGTATDSLAEFMTSIETQLAEFAPDLSIEDRIAAQRAANDELLAHAIELGASDEQLAQVRELNQERLNVLLEEQSGIMAEQLAIIQQQQAAQAELSSFLGNLAAQAAGGITPLTDQLQRLRGEYQSNIDTIERLARESGRAGASTEELAIATAAYRSQVSALIAELMASARDIVARLQPGAAPTSEPITQTSSWIGGGGGEVQQIQEVQAAVEDRYARELDLLNQLSDYVDSLNLSSLSPLTPEQRMQEAQSNYQDILARAQGGDLDALAQLRDAAQAYLQEAQSFTGGVGAYSGIFNGVQSALAGLVAAGPQNTPPPGGGGLGSSGGGGGGSTGNATVEAGDSFAQLSELERHALAEELSTVLRDLIAASGDSLLEVSEQLGLDLIGFVNDLGVNLNDLTVDTATQLAGISRNLGVDLSELASAVGFELGSLGDEQSLLNDALEQEIAGLPPDIRNQLEQSLRAIERAADPASTNAAIDDMAELINLLGPDIADALAPYFGGVVSPTDALLSVTIEQADDVASIRSILEAGQNGAVPVPPASPGDKSANVVDFAAYREEVAALRAEIKRGNEMTSKHLAEANEINKSIDRKVGQTGSTTRRM